MITRHTVRQMLPAVGSRIAVRFEAIAVDCQVIDAKNAYGQVRLLVSPLSGLGEQWVELGRVLTADPAKPGELGVSHV